MKNTFKALIILFLMIAVLKADEGKKYGKKITLTEKTKVSEILKNPASFVGKKVLIEGKVTDVCPNRGCWIKIATEDGEESIRVKVKDGEIVFPKEAKGKTALVEGEVYSFKVKSNEECDEKEHAEGAEHKEGCCSGKEQSKTVYQIKGIGAVIK